MITDRERDGQWLAVRPLWLRLGVTVWLVTSLRWALWSDSTATPLTRLSARLSVYKLFVVKLCRPSADKLCGRPPDLWPFDPNISTLARQLLLPVGNVYANFGFSAPFCFRVKPVRGRRTDRRTDGQNGYCGLLERPHNKASVLGAGNRVQINLWGSEIQRRRIACLHNKENKYVALYEYRVRQNKVAP